MSTKGGAADSPRGEGLEVFHHDEARGIAALIGQREGINPDLIFSDAMHVAVALALEEAGMPYTGPNAAWMFDRITPPEIRDILMFRRDRSDDYALLPKAGIIESMNATQLEAASTVAASLTHAELDAFFFGASSGTA